MVSYPLIDSVATGVRATIVAIPAHLGNTRAITSGHASPVIVHRSGAGIAVLAPVQMTRNGARIAIAVSGAAGACLVALASSIGTVTATLINGTIAIVVTAVARLCWGTAGIPGAIGQTGSRAAAAAGGVAGPRLSLAARHTDPIVAYRVAVVVLPVAILFLSSYLCLAGTVSVSILPAVMAYHLTNSILTDRIGIFSGGARPTALAAMAHIISRIETATIANGLTRRAIVIARSSGTNLLWQADSSAFSAIGAVGFEIDALSATRNETSFAFLVIACFVTGVRPDGFSPA